MGTLKVFGDADIESPQLLTKVSLGLENTLLRGARLKDTEFIYGDPFVFSLTELIQSVYLILP